VQSYNFFFVFKGYCTSKSKWERLEVMKNKIYVSKFWDFKG